MATVERQGQVRRTPRGLQPTMVDLTPDWAEPGLPVVLQHGIGVDRAAWADWLPLLAARRAVVGFDLRGFGDGPPLPARCSDSSDDSDDSDDSDGRLLDTLVDDLLDVLGPQPVHVVGESAGGTVALVAALRHPDRFASVTVSNTAFHGGRIGAVAGWQTLIANEGMAGWSRSLLEARFAPDAITPAHAAWFDALQRRTAAHSVLAMARMLVAVDLRATIAGLRPPLLVLAPAASPFVPLALSQDLQRAVAGAELHVFDGVRHGLPFSHAAACAARTADFIARVERRRAVGPAAATPTP